MVLTTLLAITTAIGVSAPSLSPRDSLPPRVSYFVVLRNGDTLITEAVLECPRQITGFLRTRLPRGSVLYSSDTDASGIPRSLRLTVWAGVTPTDEPPTQTGELAFRGDSAFLEVHRGSAAQVQRNYSPPGAVPFMSNYIGVLIGLFRAVALKPDSSQTVPVFFVASRGTVQRAALLHMSPDSLAISLDSTIVRARWSKTTGLSSAEIPSAGIRVVRAARPDAAPAALACRD